MFEMEDLPMKARHRDLNKPIPPKRLSQKKRELMSKPFPSRRTGSRPVKKLPPMRTPGEQPRDSFGRFARKTGAIIWGAAKGTAKAVKSAHKTVKRVQAAGRRRARLEERERRIVLAEREKKLGLRKKKITRRRRK